LRYLYLKDKNVFISFSKKLYFIISNFFEKINKLRFSLKKNKEFVYNDITSIRQYVYRRFTLHLRRYLRYRYTFKNLYKKKRSKSGKFRNKQKNLSYFLLSSLISKVPYELFFQNYKRYYQVPVILNKKFFNYGSIMTTTSPYTQKMPNSFLNVYRKFFYRMFDNLLLNY
jgi:hypothetical protein